MTRPAVTRRPRTLPEVEHLEDRRLLSVSVPPTIDLAAAVLKDTPLTVKVLSNDDPGRVLLQAPSLTATITETVNGTPRTVTLGQPLSMTRTDLNGDGVADLILTFRGSDLRGLVAGHATVDVQGSLPDGTMADASQTTTLQGSSATNTGHKTRPKHHHTTHHGHKTHHSTVQGAGSTGMTTH